MSLSPWIKAKRGKQKQRSGKNLLNRLSDCMDNDQIRIGNLSQTSYDEAINLVKRALKEAPYSDGIGLLSHLYSLKNDSENEAYWKNVLNNSDQEFLSPSIDPEFLYDDLV